MNERNVFSPFDRSLLTCGKLRLSNLIGFKTSETISQENNPDSGLLPGQRYDFTSETETPGS